MPLIDIIVNLVGLLLWFQWRSMRFDPLVRSTPASLAGTLKPTERRQLKAWQFLTGIAALLVFRAWLYWQLAPDAGWTPRMHVGFVVLAFRPDSLSATLLYSFLSFLRLLAVLYFWLVTLAILNGLQTDADPVHRLIKLHLGRAAHLPALVLLLLPALAVLGGWAAVHPLLVEAGVVQPLGSFLLVLWQGAVVGMSLVLTLKYLLPLILCVYLVVNYVYLGNSPLWEFCAGTARRILRPFHVFPIRVGRLDLSPVIAAALLLLVLEALPNFVLTRWPEMRQRIWSP